MAENTPAPAPADLNALLAKHGAAIDRIMADPRANAAELSAIGLDAATLVNLKERSSELNQTLAGAGKKTFIGTLVGAVAGFAAFFGLRKHIGEGKVRRGFFVGLGTMATGMLSGFLGGRFFGRPVEKKVAQWSDEWSQALAGVAVALEKKEQRIAAQKVEVQGTRKALGGFIGQVAIDLGVLTDAQRTQLLEMQTRFVALAMAGIKIDTGHGWDILKDEEWAKKNVDAKIVEAARARVMSGQGITKDEAPPTGDIAVKLGFISPQVKNGLLVAQAAERTITAANTVGADVAAVAGATKWKRLGEPGDPESLQSAQAVNYLSEMMNAAAKAAGAEGKAEITNARSALETLAINAFEGAAVELHNAGGADAAARIGRVASNIAETNGKSADIDPTKLERAMTIVKAGLESVRSQFPDKTWEQVQSKLAMAAKGTVMNGQATTITPPPPTPGKAQPGRSI